MKTRAAVLWGVDEEWKVEEIELDPLKPGEVLVKTAYAGMCHSDEHLVTGDLVPPDEMLQMIGFESMFPIIGGHEGSGVVTEIGEGVTDLAVGDHVSVSFVPSCGKCHWCATGRQNLCDLGATTLLGPMISDGTYRHHCNGSDCNRMAQLGTFSEHMVVDQRSLVKVDDDLDLRAVALVSCGVATGVGSARNRAEVKHGDTVVVVGIGGIGANAVQGAKVAGAGNIVAVDTNPDKQEAAEEFGATHFYTSLEDATLAVMEMTRGRMADSAILTPGVTPGEMMDPALNIISKDGTLVVTGLAPMAARDVKLDLFGLAMYNKQIRGTIFGSESPRAAIPMLLDEYRRGALKLDELVTKEYSLDDINQGYQDMRDGKNIRGVIKFD